MANLSISWNEKKGCWSTFRLWNDCVLLMSMWEKIQHREQLGTIQRIQKVISSFYKVFQHKKKQRREWFLCNSFQSSLGWERDQNVLCANLLRSFFCRSIHLQSCFQQKLVTSSVNWIAEEAFQTIRGNKWLKGVRWLHHKQVKGFFAITTF